MLFRAQIAGEIGDPRYSLFACGAECSTASGNAVEDLGSSAVQRYVVEAVVILYVPNGVNRRSWQRVISTAGQRCGRQLKHRPWNDKVTEAPSSLVNADPPPEKSGEVLLSHTPVYVSLLSVSSTVVLVTVALTTQKCNVPFRMQCCWSEPQRPHSPSRRRLKGRVQKIE
jgi:hypothetical protein